MIIYDKMIPRSLRSACLKAFAEQSVCAAVYRVGPFAESVGLFAKGAEASPRED